jgi:hypothetical protein
MHFFRLFLRIPGFDANQLQKSCEIWECRAFAYVGTLIQDTCTWEGKPSLRLFSDLQLVVRNCRKADVFRRDIRKGE